jgi:nucleoside-diphosphate-sugar epimerase
MPAASGYRDRAIDAVCGRRVLVTGASGFIGSQLTRALQACGAEVHGVSRRAQADDGIRWSSADLSEPAVAARLVRDVRPDLVYHLASHVSGDRAVGAVLPTVRDNLLTTVSVLTAACEAGGPRVVLAGSMEECVGESDAVPSSPYAAAKSAASAYGRMFHALYGLPVVSLRVFMVYGPGQRDGTKLIPYVTDCLLRGEPPRLSSGRREVDWVYVDDFVAAFLAAAGTDAATGTSVDVGSGEVTTIRSIVERLTRIVGGGRPLFGALDDRPLERRRVADVGRTRELIGWEPATPLDAGLARTVEWFRARRAVDGGI